MKFGILYNTDYYSEVHGSASHYYKQILEQVQLEEELGFDAVWFGEHHYSGYSLMAGALSSITTGSLALWTNAAPIRRKHSRPTRAGWPRSLAGSPMRISIGAT